MFQFIKSIFTKEKLIEGKLSVQNELKGEATARYVGDELRFAIKSATVASSKAAGLPQATPEIILQIKDVKDLELCAASKNSEAVIKFSIHDKKYSFESEQARTLHDVLHPLVVNAYIFETSAVSYLVYNAITRTFDPYEETIVLQVFEDIVYYLRIEDSKTIIHFEEISTNTQYYLDQQNLSFVWSTYCDARFYTFCLKFNDAPTFQEFRKAYIDSCYKAVNNKEAYDHDKGIYSNMSVYSESEIDRAEQYKKNSITADNEAKTGNGKDSDLVGGSVIAEDQQRRSNAPADSAGSNELLVMGNNRCFVTRGSSLGVFDLEPDNIKFKMQIKNSLDAPQKILTHSGDSNLLILDKEDRSHLGLMDLTRGEVIERWDMHTDVNDYFNSTKYDNTGTLVGLSDYSLFRIDPRTSEHVVSKKEYKGRNEFSCGSATGSGTLAVASLKGDLRLYDKIDKRAKTLLPGFGDPMLGIDTSKDGSLVLCTCKAYILLFQVNANYSKNSKDSTPIRLQLKPQHLTLLSDNVSFSPAKFDQDDSIIITSTGRYIIKWKVEDVLNAKVYNYSLKSLGERVVDEDFIINGKDVVVATRNDVRKINEKDLRRPN